VLKCCELLRPEVRAENPGTTGKYKWTGGGEGSEIEMEGRPKPGLQGCACALFDKRNLAGPRRLIGPLPCSQSTPCQRDLKFVR
jgi:hypothetical protein